MKKLLLIGLCLFLSVSLSAQRLFQKPLKSHNQEMNLAFSDYAAGVKLGCPWSILLDSEISKMPVGNIGYNFGFMAEYYFTKISVGIEGLFSQKGTKMSYDMTYQTSLNGNQGIFHREFFMGYNVVSIRIPATYYFKNIIKTDKVVPYILIAPQVDIPLGFNATLRQGKFLFEKPLTQTTITTYDSFYDEKKESVDVNSLLSVGVLAGIGTMIRIPIESSAIIIKFDLAANYGLRNLAEEGFIWKLDKVTKKLVPKENDRIIRPIDVEANVAIIIPIKKILRDAGYYFEDHRLFHF